MENKPKIISKENHTFEIKYIFSGLKVTNILLIIFKELKFQKYLNLNV